MIYDNPIELIGNTPIVKYQDIYIKYEGYNLTNSIKDRSALSMIKHNLDLSKTLVIATSGNLGISFAAICAYFKQNLIIIMPEGNNLKKQVMESYGSKVIETKKELGMAGSVSYLKKFNDYNKYKIINQFSNLYNPLGYFDLVREIVNDLQELDYVIVGMGSFGTYYAFSKCLKKVYPKATLIGVLPNEFPHKIDGIGSNIRTGIVKRIKDKNVKYVSSLDALTKTKELLKNGYNVGLSTGANIYIAEAIKKENPTAKVLVISADNSFKYSERLHD